MTPLMGLYMSPHDGLSRSSPRVTVMTCLSRSVTYMLNRLLLLLRTSRLCRIASVLPTIWIAAAELHEEIHQRKQLWVDVTLRIGEQMDRFVVSCSHSRTYHLGRRHP